MENIIDPDQTAHFLELAGLFADLSLIKGSFCGNVEYTVFLQL